MTLNGSRLKFLLFSPLKTGVVVNQDVTGLFTTLMHHPRPLPSICLSMPAFHQLSLYPLASPSLFSLPSPIFFPLRLVFCVFLHPSQTPSSICLIPPVLSFPVSRGLWARILEFMAFSFSDLIEKPTRSGQINKVKGVRGRFRFY